MTSTVTTSDPIGESESVRAVTQLEKTLGYRFKNQSLLIKALRHASTTTNRLHSNERLEFLGDRILGMIIAEHLLTRFPKDEEGALGYRFTALTRAETLTRVAKKIDIGSFIQISGEDHANANMLADACEALIAALYLDGGLEAAQSFIIGQWHEIIEEQPQPTKDAKTQLQEWLQKSGDVLPTYETVNRTGADHEPVFTVSVTIPGGRTASGTGANKRAAEQNAAKALIEQLLPRKGCTS